MDSSVRYQTKFGPYEYMYMCLNAIAWHLGHQSTFVRAVCCAVVGNTLGTKGDFGDLFDSEPAVWVMCLALERVKTDACLFLSYLWEGSFVWFPGSWGSFILCCLLTLFSVMCSDDRCSFHKQLKMHVCPFSLRLSDLLTVLCQSARAKRTCSQSSSWWEYVKAVNYLFLTGKFFTLHLKSSNSLTRIIRNIWNWNIEGLWFYLSTLPKLLASDCQHRRAGHP